MMMLFHKVIQFVVNYDVFISVEEQDLNYAKNIRDFLRKYGARVFIYKESIEGGTKWREIIKENLKDCSLFVVLLSSNSLKSPDVGYEMGGAYFSDKDYLPVLLEDVDKKELGMTSEIQYVKYSDDAFWSGLRKRLILVYGKRAILLMIVIAIFIWNKIK